MSETAAPAQTSTTQEADIASALGRRSVVLVGMMGAGKSTIGRRLAARLRLPFLDADIEIEAAAGMSIPDIFETHGEPHFRRREAVYRTADLTIGSRDVPHDRIVDECIDALRARLCSGAPSAEPTTDGMSVTP